MLVTSDPFLSQSKLLKWAGVVETDGPRFAAFAKKYGRHIKGGLAGTGVVFEPWMLEDICLALAIDPKTGLRIYRDVVFSWPKKHAKSLIAALLGFYLVGPFEGENGPEGYALAGSKDQARVVHNVARLMADPKSPSHSPLLADLFKVTRDSITCARNDGFWRVVAHNSDMVEGSNPNFASCDEYAVHPDSELRDNIYTAMIAREQPLLFTISTVGNDTGKPLYKLEHDSRILKEVYKPNPYKIVAHDKDGGYLFIKYGLDENSDADIEDPAVLKGVNVASWITEPALKMLLHSTSMREVSFRRKHMNQWSSTGEDGIDSEKWDACESDLKLEPGQQVTVGIDAGVTDDWSALVVAGKVKDRVVIEQYLWQPPEQGQLDLHSTIDVKLMEVMAKYQVLNIACDRFFITTMMQTWLQRGWPVEDFPQWPSHMCPASVVLFNTINDKVLAHDGDSDMRTHILNAIIEETNRGWRFNRREDRERKIDGLVAALMAVSRLLGSEHSVYNDRGLTIL